VPSAVGNVGTIVHDEFISSMKEMFETMHDASSQIIEISENHILECCDVDIIHNLKSWEWIFAKGPKFELQFCDGQRVSFEEGRIISSNNIDLIGEKLSNSLLLRLSSSK
jgi:hypothetical protein